MISTNPAAPTLTLIACPITRIRSAVVPAVKFSPPNKRRIAAGASSISRRIGTVPATVQRVIDLKSASSFSRSPRACRSATNGENTYETAVRNSTIARATRTHAAYTPRSSGVTDGSPMYAATK
jgi:hypothetical protein